MSNSYFLELPFLAAAQNQKHITLNESLSRLDIVVQLSVLTKSLTVIPSSPAEGERYIIADAATADWSGLDGLLAVYQDGAWHNITAKNGWKCWVEDEQKLYVFNGSAWQEYAAKKSLLKPDVLICEEMAYAQDSTNPPSTGWNQRYLNLIKINNLGAGVVLDAPSSQFSLPVGTYWVKIMSAAMRVGKHKTDLKHIDSGMHLIEGSCEHSEFGASSTAALTRSIGEGELTVTDDEHNYALMHHVELGDVDNWRFGHGGEGPSINCKIELWKL
ncbi:MAG: DUF2793 domain-containing protein [Alphaproteobacteria bacterium]|nr:DUF2793 domain-containing protein [Alphaproteobacteria bacterium]